MTIQELIEKLSHFEGFASEKELVAIITDENGATYRTTKIGIGFSGEKLAIFVDAEEIKDTRKC